MVRSAVRSRDPELVVRKECNSERLVALSGVLLVKQRKVDEVDHTRAKYEDLSWQLYCERRINL
jgi:hypothetical protein